MQDFSNHAEPTRYKHFMSFGMDIVGAMVSKALLRFHRDNVDRDENPVRKVKSTGAESIPKSHRHDCFVINDKAFTDQRTSSSSIPPPRVEHYEHGIYPFELRPLPPGLQPAHVSPVFHPLKAAPGRSIGLAPRSPPARPFSVPRARSGQVSTRHSISSSSKSVLVSPATSSKKRTAQTTPSTSSSQCIPVSSPRAIPYLSNSYRSREPHLKKVDAKTKHIVSYASQEIRPIHLRDISVVSSHDALPEKSHGDSISDKNVVHGCNDTTQEKRARRAGRAKRYYLKTRQRPCMSLPKPDIWSVYNARRAAVVILPPIIE